MKRRRITFTMLVILCLCTIFLFSHQIGKTSESISDRFTIKIIDIYSRISGKEFSASRRKELVKDLRKVVRKSAHFTIYFLLGIFVYGTLKNYRVKHAVLFAILFCFLYACSDEVHQLFVANRTGRVFDVLIDTFGASVGIGLVFLFKKLIKDN